MHLLNLLILFTFTSFLTVVNCREQTRIEVKYAKSDEKISTSIFLRHYQNALLEKKDLTIDELAHAETLNFVNPPDPSDLYEWNVTQAKAGIAKGTKLNILSFNAGLLHRKKILGLFGLTQVPEYELRRTLAAKLIFAENFDVIGLQEVWDESDKKSFVDEAALHGYWIYTGGEDSVKHGCILAVKQSLIEKEIFKSEHFYTAQYKMEHFPGPNLKRGFLVARIKIKNITQPVLLINTHTSPFVSFSAIRNRQVLELANLINDHKDSNIILAGDFNAGSYEKQDWWIGIDKETNGSWWNSTVMYGLLLHYTGVIDSYIAINGKNNEKQLLDKLPEYSTSQNPEIPYGKPEICDATQGKIFTATECNRLYFWNYKGGEPLDRIDYIFVRGALSKDKLKPTVKIHSSKLAFTENLKDSGKNPLSSSGKDIPLSDHYGVVSVIQFD